MRRNQRIGLCIAMIACVLLGGCAVSTTVTQVDTFAGHVTNVVGDGHTEWAMHAIDGIYRGKTPDGGRIIAFFPDPSHYTSIFFMYHPPKNSMRPMEVKTSDGTLRAWMIRHASSGRLDDLATAWTRVWPTFAAMSDEERNASATAIRLEGFGRLARKSRTDFIAGLHLHTEEPAPVFTEWVAAQNPRIVAMEPVTEPASFDGRMRSRLAKEHEKFDWSDVAGLVGGASLLMLEGALEAGADDCLDSDFNYGGRHHSSHGRSRDKDDDKDESDPALANHTPHHHAPAPKR